MSEAKITTKGIGQGFNAISIANESVQGGGGVGKGKIKSVECRNIFKGEGNIKASFNALWADIINFKVYKNFNAESLEICDNTGYNKDVQSCPNPVEGVRQP
ncbi:MAG: hypothetical protein FWH08_00265 [Oscillospiraceae bacterium]|nr:hypothetical protein [Oscillospiraceae bacterium]